MFFFSNIAILIIVQFVADGPFELKVLPTLFVERIEVPQQMQEDLICRYCKWKFERNVGKVLHEKKCPLKPKICPNEEIAFNCNNCNLRFSTKYLLNRHKRYDCNALRKM